MENIINLKNDISIGKCIYCGEEKEKLTKEHVIPYALGGTIILHNASCEECRRVTSQYERNPLSENWREVRAFLDYPSRKRKFEEEIFKLSVVLKNGKESILELRKKEILGMAQFLEYSLPGIFLKNGMHEKGVMVTGVSVFGLGIDLKEFAKKYNVKSFTHTMEHKSFNFERMVIRIAYSFVVVCWGYDCLDERLTLPVILNQKDDVGYWFGCDPLESVTPAIGKQNGMNVMKIGIYKNNSSEKRYAVVRLKFFAGTDTPEYIVAVGTLRNDFSHQNINKINYR